MTPITTEDLTRMLSQQEDLILINTLPREAFEKTKIPNSINIPQDQDFVAQVENRAGGRSKTIVVYCANQECDSSTKAAMMLENAGFEAVFDYEGGAKEWHLKESNVPVQA